MTGKATNESESVRGESSRRDLKIDHNPDDRRAQLELVKDIVSMANSGGGSIRFGASETDTPGVHDGVRKALDSATLAAQVDSYVRPGSVRLSHEVTDLGRGGYLVDLIVDAVETYPLVISKEGQYRDDDGNTKSVFARGDIWVRRSSKNEKASFEDVGRFIDRAVKADRAQMMEALQGLVQLPPGAKLVAQIEGGGLAAGPRGVLDALTKRRSEDRGALANYGDLLYCFIERKTYKRSKQDLELLIRSALRRTGTLFFWLAELNDPDATVSVILSSLEDKDRDKSDAAKAMLEVATLMAEDAALEGLLEGLKASDYQHFREAAEEWKGREVALRAFDERVAAAQTLDGTPASDFEDEVLDEAADVIAGEMLKKSQSRQSRLSRLLSDLGRVKFARAIRRLK